ncbi:DEAD/DEAH box helicase [Patescibacteria group bacterium]|nr:DEAD/DEAH box helicase [Patescibacteria group bacterium]MCG2702154.1 DEAD/DEAH box helicase [Candidatus Parcubacteria bacterium]MBU4264803.1 DEAD/DEAH box helicase [Patescibacteria group bacterium]MBU4390141.1 DEAD/DEAH box helicase [Patescibacteria group bacterium]MBU4397226.1 DEAD/DEAH box helicase [Patescibacteria group bacterium]
MSRNNCRGRFNRYSKQGQGQGRYNNKRRGFGKKSIDTSLYIKKAEEFVNIEDIETVNSFRDFNLCPELLANVKAKGYLKPTQIQDQAIPHIINNRDVLGLADTGTGKTAAFALPIINKILNNQNERIIVIAPTRELAQQIEQEFNSFTSRLRVFSALAIGGAYLREQINKIRRGPHIIIGTPGRIIDLGKRNVINFRGLNTVVLDEVDRMLDMGFINDIKSIVDQTPNTRQTLFFSATIDRRLEPLIDTFLNNPVKISIKTANASSHVEQDIVRVTRYAKEQKLHDLMGLASFKKVLVFGSTRRIVEKLSRSLVQDGFRAQGLHGGKQQNQRQRIMRDFRENRTRILVATDVASRGLDVTDITHVINYDEPNNYEEYIHRIGRTGRVNNKGYALTFVE